MTVRTVLHAIRATVAPGGTRRAEVTRLFASVARTLSSEGLGAVMRRVGARLGRSSPGSRVPAARERALAPVELIRLDDRSPASFAAALSFPEASKPVVSVIVPVLNKVEYTLC